MPPPDLQHLAIARRAAAVISFHVAVDVMGLRRLEPAPAFKQWTRSADDHSTLRHIHRLLSRETAAVMLPPHRTARQHSEASSSRHGKGPTRDAALMGPLVATGAGDVAPAATRAPATPLPAAHRRSPRTGPVHAAVSLLSPGMVARLPVEAAQGLTRAAPVAVAVLPITWQCWGGKQTSCTHVGWKKQGPLQTTGTCRGM